jgi:lycopene cyclase domain-containing protein
MDHYLYLAVLLACLMAPIILELTLRVRIFIRWRRLAATVLPITVLFSALDVIAVRAGDWTYASRWLIGIRFAGGLPIEEVLFFAVIPVCAVATLEAVRRCRPQWAIGDEDEGL